MGRRPDSWLVEGALIVRAADAHALWPLLQRGMGEWARMGAVHRLEAVGDLLARWRHLAELEDQRLRSSVGGSGVSGTGDVSSACGHAVHLPATEAAAEAPQQQADTVSATRTQRWMSSAEAAMALRCSPRWVTALARRGELDARLVGRQWLIDPASVAAYRRRSAA